MSGEDSDFMEETVHFRSPLRKSVSGKKRKNNEVVSSDSESDQTGPNQGTHSDSERCQTGSNQATHSDSERGQTRSKVFIQTQREVRSGPVNVPI